MKYSVVLGVCSDVALVEVNVVNAMKTVGVAELLVNWLVKILVELCPERIDLTPGVLALIKVQRQQVLQIVTAGTAGRRQHSSQRPIE